MNYCYDTEFLEDGRTIDLISIGIVCVEDGREYYAVSRASSSALYRAQFDGHWIVKNVLPHLPLTDPKEFVRRDGGRTTALALDDDHPDVKHWHVIRDEVYEFLTVDLPVGQRPRLWAQMGAYDHVALCQLWGPMVALPAPLPYFTHEIEQVREDVSDYAQRNGYGDWCKWPKQEGPRHHALYDARFDRDLLQTAWDLHTAVVLGYQK